MNYSLASSVPTLTFPILTLAPPQVAVFSKTQRHLPAATEASSRYHRLLRVAQKRVAHVATLNMDERSIDSCLLAFFLMGRYEGAVYRRGDLDSTNSSTSLQSWPHHDGAMAVLKVWNDSLSHSPATTIIKQTRRGLIRSSLLRNIPLPQWMQNGSRFGERGLELEYDHIFNRLVNLHYASARLQQNPGLQFAKAEELNNEARELDKALHHWAAQFPSTWSYRRHILEESGPWPKRNFFLQ